MKDRLNLQIEITDTGVGIEAEQLESLFDNYKKIMDNRELNK
jgi:signal transduction histidine kinase